MAVPTPPPILTAVPKFSMCDGLPRGPTTSCMNSPSLRVLSSLVVLPIPWTMIVIVPFSGSESAMVRGILSPPSFILIITNCPAFLLKAILGASISNLLISGAINLAEII
jgi:hypothetical protein